MKRIAKLFLIGCLMTGTFLISGCEEGSYSFEHSSSVEVSTDSGVNYSTSYSETRSANGLLTYKLNDVNLLDGKTEIYLSITNNGNKDTTLNAITISFKATDSKGNVISDGISTFDKLSLQLPKDKEVYESFTIEDPNYKKFDNDFNINCEFNDVILNPPLE